MPTRAVFPDISALLTSILRKNASLFHPTLFSFSPYLLWIITEKKLSEKTRIEENLVAYRKESNDKSVNIYAAQQDTQCVLMSKFIQHLC